MLGACDHPTPTPPPPTKSNGSPLRWTLVVPVANKISKSTGIIWKSRFYPKRVSTFFILFFDLTRIFNIATLSWRVRKVRKDCKCLVFNYFKLL